MDRAISLQRRTACRHWKWSGKALPAFADRKGLRPGAVNGKRRKRRQGPGCPKNLAIFGSYPARPLPIDRPSPPMPTAAGDVEDITPENARKERRS